ncbi:MAG: NUDIX hydrolase [Tissierellia bacterium]|nr:NUDIX hydrolase [Tissierellia bacterium]
MIEVSAGGVIFYHNSICILQKYSGDWVLPKGRRERHETLEETALREVFEETGVRANILDYIGQISYEYRLVSSNYRKKKKVNWFLMEAQSTQCQPLRKEGFMKAQFVQMEKAQLILAFDSERHIVQKAIKMHKEAM